MARIVAEFAEDRDPLLERVRIAEPDGRPAGCVMCVRDAAPGAARLRPLFVEPDAAGAARLRPLFVEPDAAGAAHRRPARGGRRRLRPRGRLPRAGPVDELSFGVDAVGRDRRPGLPGTTDGGMTGDAE
ncbi:hypothetical protein [Streptomyces capitiformicae]|uniref:Uncharacterized protein n=1 Tax=Streptomyces capitiformicae TaxID=2014920 RepID=A0A919DM30_9ACTN|nr:hypothetical protein [Streptomyces capitiformicae]GHE58430.1 hypothetical protein GCM10017771_81380 [Streptomyces capitiformicae]